MQCPQCPHAMNFHIFAQRSNTVICIGCHCVSEIENPLVWIYSLDGAVSVEFTNVLVNMWQKFHRETECGEDGMHWQECENFNEYMRRYVVNRQ